MIKVIKDKLISSLPSLVAICVVVGVLFVVDYFDFLSRWSMHFMPYKNNAERVFYFVCVVILIWRMREWISQRMKSLKFSAGDYGFEVEFKNSNSEEEGENKSEDEEVDLNASTERTFHSRRSPNIPIGARFEMLAIDEISKELGVCFSSTPSIRQGNMLVEFDGYAEKDGRIYIVEAKISDRIDILRREVGRMSTFAMRLPPEKRARLTFVLYILTSKTTKQIRHALLDGNSTLAYDLQVRTIDSKQFDEEEKKRVRI